MKFCGYFLTLLPIFFGCDGNGPYTPKVDPRSQTLLNKIWQLYSNDIVDTSNGQMKYILRVPADSCIERITFKNPNVLTQVDSCSAQSIISYTGTWEWYEHLPILAADINTDSLDQLGKNGFRYSGDTLQFIIASGPAIDSTYTRFYLRIRTYVNRS